MNLKINGILHKNYGCEKFYLKICSDCKIKPKYGYTPRDKSLLKLFWMNLCKFESMSSREEINDYIGYLVNGDQNDIKRLRQYYTKYISKSKRKSLNYEERIKHMSPEEIDNLKRKNSRFRVWYNKNLIKKDIKNDRIQSRRSSILGIQNLGNLQLAMRKLRNIAK